MAYNNPFWYNRDNSVNGQYYYIFDFSINFDPGTYLSYNTDLLTWPHNDQPAINWVNDNKANFIEVAENGVQIFRLNPYKHYAAWGKHEARGFTTKYPKNPFIPIYGSSVEFESRLNILETTNNNKKILPNSENNLIVTYNLKFLLDDSCLGNILKTIEIAAGVKLLKFSDPSNFYKNIVGYVEDYYVQKASKNLNELNITLKSYNECVFFKWKTSAFLNIDSSCEYSKTKSYQKYDFVYYDSFANENKIDNFWFAKENNIGIIPGEYDSFFKEKSWSKNRFIFETKYPFNLKNKLDVQQFSSKNSYIKNLKNKNNINTLKEYEIKFENISNHDALSILLFLEKKCGYRRFIYEFPFLLRKEKVFICTKWSHSLKYFDCNDITAIFVEDSDAIVENLTYDFNANDSLMPKNFTGVIRVNNSPIIYVKGVASDGFYDGFLIKFGKPAYGVFPNENNILTFYENGLKSSKSQTLIMETVTSVNNSTSTATNYRVANYSESGLLLNNIANQRINFYNGKIYLYGVLLDDGISNIVTDGIVKLVVVRISDYSGYGSVMFYDLNGNLYNGLFNSYLILNGKLPLTNTSTTYSGKKYVGYFPIDYSYVGTSTVIADMDPSAPIGSYRVLNGYLYQKDSFSRWLRTTGNVTFNNRFFSSGVPYIGYYYASNMAFLLGYKFTGKFSTSLVMIETSSTLDSSYMINGSPLQNSNSGVTYNGYFYQHGLKIISNGYYNNNNYVNGYKK